MELHGRVRIPTPSAAISPRRNQINGAFALPTASSDIVISDLISGNEFITYILTRLF